MSEAELLREVRETRAEVVKVGHAVEMHDGKSKGYAERIHERVDGVETAVSRFEAACERLTETIEARIPVPNGNGKKSPLQNPSTVLWFILGAIIAGSPNGAELVRGIISLFSH